jgi:Flp pilus assembly secretin CpaC
MSSKFCKTVISISIAATCMLGAPLPSTAAETVTAPANMEDGAPISVRVNMARILRISAPAATVIIGNPGVADVTIQDPKTLILTGKSYGQTNMIVLDAKGNPIADTLLQVIQSQANVVTIYNAGERNTLSCTPKCEGMVMLGDNAGFSQTVIGSATLVQGMAQSQ